MKKLLAVLLAITVVMSMGVVAFAAGTKGPHAEDSTHGTADTAGVASAGENKFTDKGEGAYGADSKFYLNIDGNAISGDTSISVEVPLWVCMYAYGGDGKVVTPGANNYMIANRSSVAIQVTKMDVAPAAGWSFGEFKDEVVATGYKPSSNNLTVAKQLALKINDVPMVNGTTEYTPSDWKIASSGTTTPVDMDLPLKAYIAPGVNTATEDVQVVTVTYTVKIAPNETV